MIVKTINRPESAREVCLSVLKTNNLIYAVLVLLVAGAGVWLTFGSPESGLLPVGIGFLVSTLVLPLMQAWKVKRYIKQFEAAIAQSGAQGTEQFIIFDERIVCERRVSDEIVGKTVVEYSRIRRSWETKNLILIHTYAGQMLVLAKCDLAVKEQADVKRLLVTVGVRCKFK